MALWFRALQLIQRAQVGFLAPTWQLTAISNYSARRSDTLLLWPAQAPAAHMVYRQTLIHIK